MKHPIRLLALDLDGTVLNDAKHISPANRYAIQDALAAGVTVVPASGRPLDGLCPEFLDIPGVQYALTSNGAALYRLRDKALLYHECLPTGTAADIMAALEHKRMLATFFLNGKGYVPARQLPYLDELPLSQPIRDYLRATRTPLEDAAGFIREQGNVEKFSINFFHNPDGSRVDNDAIEGVLSRYPDLSAVSGGTDNLELTAPKANKGAALLALAEFLGIPRAATMACGDSENDVAMLDAAGLGVAMANSEACVFAHADVTTVSNEEDGVAKAIYDYIL